MDQLDAMRTFVQIVDQGSLSAAARRLRISQPSVVRSLAGLERKLGARLIQRTTRRMHLTEAGSDFYRRCGQILEIVDEAQRVVSARQHVPSGTLVVSAPLIFGRTCVGPLLGSFMERHPKVVVELALSDRNVDLIEDGVDVAVRIGDLPDSGLAAVRLGMTQRVLIAGKGYLRRHGIPRAPEELSRHNCLHFAALWGSREWRFMREGREVAVRVSGTLTSNSGDAVIQTALENRGIANVLYYQVMEHVTAGRLRLVLQPFALKPIPVSALFAHPRLVSAKIQAFVDHLKRHFARRSFLPL